jgi:hypothetical protein
VEKSDGCKVCFVSWKLSDYSVMIPKLDKRALALRIFGKDSDEPVQVQQDLEIIQVNGEE